jgi:hypothetical protein
MGVASGAGSAGIADTGLATGFTRPAPWLRRTCTVRRTEHRLDRREGCRAPLAMISPDWYPPSALLVTLVTRRSGYMFSLPAILSSRCA